MPVLLGQADLTGWPDGTLGAEAPSPAPATVLREWPVSKRINSAPAPATMIQRCSSRWVLRRTSLNAAAL
jgi:hypothetical protein